MTLFLLYPLVLNQQGLLTNFKRLKPPDFESNDVFLTYGQNSPRGEKK
ncbi:hypothetical protein MCEREM21_01564 [Burkholderiaceae bacterium]